MHLLNKNLLIQNGLIKYKNPDSLKIKNIITFYSLKIGPDSDSVVSWYNYIDVHQIDKQQLANKRVCPKITDRHLYLDTLSKMSVKLATQVL